MQDNKPPYFPLVTICHQSLPLSCTLVNRRQCSAFQAKRVFFSVYNTSFIKMEVFENVQYVKIGQQLV